ncbi:putative paraflagellar rod component [Leptomonas pyrrhocoris]|uniref:Putative paraflagellar rod component n=1 Tax=Leptomonas pyrrhocoris TaxID=157538 RepID=A0A0M9G3L4_LEPPY|nr:putative paraflagellar rod component [Leptomonas pyrrhocoris]KPA81730.1 putative paraflagellar rod component [Leptomonas pyrrhocoris]|eukprot:XP_015660169.1 putative paraflagellar rod component [Leptomonas pyrrhocoris]
MDKVDSSLTPLSPFTWDGREENGVPSNCSANAVLHDIALLDLRFDLIIDEFAVPCHHTLHLINDGFPLRRKNLTARQLQLLQYGVVVHGGTRLVIVAVPPCCGDSGACLAASYKHLFSRSLDTASAVAHHPFLAEHTFVVYRLPGDVGNKGQEENAHAQPQQHPQALFRLVYRNVNPHSSNSAATSVAAFNVAEAPEYKLVSVLVSSATYYGELQRVSQYRREWYTRSTAVRASCGEAAGIDSAVPLRESSTSYPLPEPVAAEVRRTSSLSELCTLFARVLERFSPLEIDGAATTENAAWGDDEDGQYADGKTHDAAAENANDTAAAGDKVPRRGSGETNSSGPWSYQYTRDGARLISRLDVVERTKAALQSWRDGELDLTTEAVVSRTPPLSAKKVDLGDHSTHPPLSLQARRVPCARLLFQPSRRNVATHISENEIVSFLPNDAPTSSSNENATDSFYAVVYASPAAERLRRWILQGLVAAEVHGVHVVFLDLDPVNMLQPCVELLAQADVSNTGGEDDSIEAEASTAEMRFKRALLLVCQVAMETVERFMRHSGLVWKVTVAVREVAAAADSAATTTPPTLDAVSFTAWCTDMLELIRDAETRRENSAQCNTLSFTEDGGRAAKAAALIAVQNQNALVSDGGLPQQDHLSASQQLALRTQEVVQRALTLYTHDATGPAAPLPQHIVTKAKEVGVKVSDNDLYLLFQTFCAVAKRRDGLLPASALVDVLSEEWSAEVTKRRRYAAPSKRLVCPLDCCGVPISRARVQRFLQPFLDVMRDAPLGQSNRTVGGVRTTSPQLLNYAQFSMVMFAIAKM